VSRDISKAGVALVIALFTFAIAMFIYLVPRFGGPSLSFSQPYQLRAQFHNTLALEKSAGVLIRGVDVGSVSGISVNGDVATVTFTVGNQYEPLLHADATVRIGLKTALGEPYVDLTPGTAPAPRLRSGALIRHTIPTVTVDQALQTLSAGNESQITSLLHTAAAGVAAPLAEQELGATIVQSTRFVDQLDTLTSTLHGQDGELATLVRDGTATLTALGSRQQSLAAIVRDGRLALGAVAAQNAALRAGMHELPSLLDSARSTLITAHPLLVDARPVVVNLGRAAPALTVDFEKLRPVSADASTVLADLPGFNATAVGVLHRAVPAVDAVRPAARGIVPDLANLIPVGSYLQQHERELVAWFSQTRAASEFGDAKGKFYRFLIFAEPDTLLGINGLGQLAGANPYTAPGDATNNQAYRPGDYQRLMPYPSWAKAGQ
jgi:phospholipid/cholesterol/gamma-HCH transport system substrate-binding protein